MDIPLNLTLYEESLSKFSLSELVKVSTTYKYIIEYILISNYSYLSTVTLPYLEPNSHGCFDVENLFLCARNSDGIVVECLRALTF